MSRLVVGQAPARRIPWGRIGKWGGLALVVGLIAARAFFVQVAIVRGNTMAPGLAEGDVVLVLTQSAPRLGDVVLLERGDRLVWRRVLGVPGDEVGTLDGVLTRGSLPLETRLTGAFGYFEGEERTERRQQAFIETLEDGRSHAVLGDHQGAARPWILEFHGTEVPPGYLFVFCDNRRTCPLDELSGLVPVGLVGGVASRLMWYGDARMEAPPDGSMGGAFVPLSSHSDLGESAIPARK